MKPINIEFKLGILRYLFFIPFLLFTFCDNSSEEIYFSDYEMITKDSKVISLMKSAVKSNSDKELIKSGNTNSDASGQCVEFQYPMTFSAYIGDNPTIQVIVINSDEELLEFFNMLTTTNQIYIIFPVILIDVDGLPTEIENITDLEGTLQMALDACGGNGSDDGNDDGSNDGNDDGSNDGNDDGSNDGDEDNYDFDFCHSNNKKVYICHKGQTICVSINAIWGHTNQHEEDYLGQCDE